MASILVLNGPNLNLLGVREQGIYGSTSLQAILDACQRFADSCGFQIEHLQANAEHVLVDRIQQCVGSDTQGVVFNPAAFTHTSVALRDALLAVAIPFVEVHLSQPLARESFRHVSYFSDIALGTVSGFGADSYLLGLQALINHLDTDGTIPLAPLSA
ncbi:MAG: type II 3-dehydroquinate dehydratase [Gammaproteobacteria bacterium]|jgi:3-dehydroquinate dehydratase-2|nr:type II 3-dehydroquinate dehydratase [Gammaproteobacteria bacterium]